MVLVVPEQSQRPYRFGMTLLCVGALFNWLGLADTYSDPVPAIRYIGVGLIAAGASLICMAMCFWMRNIHDPNMNSDYDVSTDPVHVISIDPSLEKPPDYSTVVDIPPCYEEAIKLSPATLASVIQPTKLAPTTNVLITSQCSGDADRHNSLQSGQSCDNVDFSSATEKSEEIDSSTTAVNSSQNENALAKVLRKSIRGIRRLRSGSEGPSEHPPGVENGCGLDRTPNPESTLKTEK